MGAGTLRVGVRGARLLRDTAWQLLIKGTVPSMHGPDIRLSVPPSVASLREVKAGVRLKPALGVHSCSLRGCLGQVSERASASTPAPGNSTPQLKHHTIGVPSAQLGSS